MTSTQESETRNSAVIMSELANEADGRVEGSMAEEIQSKTNTGKSASTRMTSAQLMKFAQQHGLPPPLFDWQPRLADLPSEILHRILDFSDFVVTARDKKSPWAQKQQDQPHELPRHNFLVLAGVTPRLEDIVEKHCELLLKQHLVAGLMTQSRSEVETSRGQWLRYISIRCIFCFQTLDEVKDADKNLDTDTSDLGARRRLQRETSEDMPPIIDRKRLEALIGSPFNHDILCCEFCEADKWPNAILFEVVAEKYSIPESLMLLPSEGLDCISARKTASTISKRIPAGNTIDRPCLLCLKTRL